MKTIIAAAMAATLLSGTADAQKYYMRERLLGLPITSGPQTDPGSPTTPTPPVSPTQPTQPAAWTIGEWSSWSSECSDTAIRTRSVTCVKDGSAVTESSCTESKPNTSSSPTGRYGSCEYSYRNGYLGSVAPNSYCQGDVKQYKVYTACFKKDAYLFGDRAADSACAGLAKPATFTASFPCENIGVRYDNSPVGGNAALRNFEIRYVPGILTSTQAMKVAKTMCNERAATRYGPTGTGAATCHFRRYATNAGTGQTAVEAGLLDEFSTDSSFPTGDGWTTKVTGNTGINPSYIIRLTRNVELPDDYKTPCDTMSASPYWGIVC